jgi:hypothetical protein
MHSVQKKPLGYNILFSHLSLFRFKFTSFIIFIKKVIKKFAFASLLI